VIVIVLRLLWVYPGAYLAYAIRRRFFGQNEANPSARSTFVLGWAGMRGVIALAAAISSRKFCRTVVPSRIAI